MLENNLFVWHGVWPSPKVKVFIAVVNSQVKRHEKTWKSFKYGDNSEHFQTVSPKLYSTMLECHLDECCSSVISEFWRIHYKERWNSLWGLQSLYFREFRDQLRTYMYLSSVLTSETATTASGKASYTLFVCSPSLEHPQQTDFFT